MWIEGKNLTLKTPDQRLIASKISFSLGKSELLLIEGDNGSGKTTLIKTILGIHKNFEGSLEKNIDFSEFDYVPQQANLQFFIPVTLGDVITLKYRDSDRLNFLSEDQKKRPWNVASGGEKQKAIMTRSLQTKSKVLILDEPFNHLDRDSKTKLITVLNDQANRGKSIILISHESSVQGLHITKKIFLEPYA